MANRPGIGAHSVAGVAFDGVDVAVFDFLDDAYMIGFSVLAFAGTIPVEVDEVAGGRDMEDICQAITLFSTIHFISGICLKKI